LERAKILDQLAQEHRKKVKIHLKIDASLGRQGILLDDCKEFALELKKLKHLHVVAAYAHFANIEDIGDPTEGAPEFSHARKQIEEFQKAVKIIMKNGFPRLRTHISSTAGTLVHEKNNHHDDFIRLGIGLYGLWPSKNIRHVLEPLGFTLQPALRWISRIAQVKTLPANATIGYGLTARTYKPTTIAVVPQGYSDGYDRGLSNKGEVLIHGTRCQVFGRVMMNMIVVDVSHLTNPSAEDEVVLLGTQGEQAITAEELAAKIDTINYEIVARLNSTLPRTLK
jgi:alanine racemase